MIASPSTPHEISPQEREVVSYYDRDTEAIYLRAWDPEHLHFGLFEYPSVAAPAALVRSAMLHTAIEAMIEAVVAPARLRPGSIVVDAGCGVGGTARYLARRFDTRVIGLNVCESQLRLAREQTRAVGLGERVDFEWADCSTHLPLADGSVDVVVNMESACHYSNRPAFVRECARILAPGGMLVASDWVAMGDADADVRARLIAPLCRSWHVTDLDTPASYAAIVRAAGLDVVELAPFDARVLPNAAVLRYQADRLAAAAAVRAPTPQDRDWHAQFDSISRAWIAGAFGLLRYAARRPDTAAADSSRRPSAPSPPLSSPSTRPRRRPSGVRRAAASARAGMLVDMDGMLADRLRGRILVALALGSACTDRDLDDTSGAGDDTGDADGTTTAGSATPATDEGGSAPATTMPADDGEVDDGEVDDGEVDDGEVDDGNVHFDLGGVPDGGVPPPPPPFLDCDDPPPLAPDGACTLAEHDEYADVTVCFENLEGGACPPARTPEPLDALDLCSGGVCLTDICGPDPANEPVICCYWAITGECNPGRPFVVRGVDRLANVRTRDDWRDAIELDGEQLSPALRDALARAWTEDGRCEHAAVASFARFTLQLLALGAPADLVARAQRAGLDELAHARAFFGLASAYAGAPVGPGPLDTSDALADGTDLEHVVVATVREGCIAETISLVQLATAQANARDPILRSLLATIVEEELEHVELAWSFVGWALARGDARLHAAVATAFRAAETAIPRSSASDSAPADANEWHAHGRLSATERSSSAHATLREIVRPCAARLLARRAGESAEATQGR